MPYTILVHYTADGERRTAVYQTEASGLPDLIEKAAREFSALPDVKLGAFAPGRHDRL